MTVVCEYTVSTEFAPAIINGDYSGLDGIDTALLKAWLKREEAGNGRGHWDGFDGDGFYARCEIIGQHDACGVLRWVRP